MQKEYLQKLEDGSYKLVVLSDVVDCHDGLIEVPEGSDSLHITQDGTLFFTGFVQRIKCIYSIEENRWSLGYADNSDTLLWQRESGSDDNHISDVDKTLGERQSQYGEFNDVAHTTQYLLQMLSTDEMSDVQLEALHMICSKLARITHGDVNHVDSWHDIAGYATLVVNELENK